MITLFVTHDTKRSEIELAKLLASKERPERYDGADMTLATFADAVAGMSLFSSARVVVIRGLSGNTTIWSVLDTWFDRVAEDTTVVLVESRVDKRTKVYKTLHKNGAVTECLPLTERHVANAWANDQAKHLGVKLGAKQMQAIVERSLIHDEAVAKYGYYNDWVIYNALTQLALFDGEITDSQIDAVLPASQQHTIFELLEAALKRDERVVNSLLVQLEHETAVQAVFGLLATQCLQLVAVVCSDDSVDAIAAELGMHPYPLKKLRALRLSRARAYELVNAIAVAEERSRSGIDPWHALGQALR